jgi:hypothetical protein
MHIFDAVVICEAINVYHHGTIHYALQDCYQDILLPMLTATFEAAEATML